MKKLGVKWNIFLYLIGFCFLLLLILWLFETVFLDSFYKRIKLREIGRGAGAIADCIRAEDFEGIVRIVSARGDLYVEIASDRYGIIVISSRDRAGRDPRGYAVSPSQYSVQEKLEYRQKALENGGRASIQFESGDRESLIQAIVLEAAGGEVLLLVSADLTPVGATVETLRIQLVYISLVMLALAGLLALLIAKRVAKPIVALSESARQLAGGDYGVRFRAGGYREIGELSETLDAAARELAKTERLRRELIANVSHDLRTPLTLIAGYAELVRDMPGEATPENMQVVIDEAKRLSSLVESLLDLSRLQAGVQALRFEEFNLTARVEEIAARFSRLCEKEGYTVRFEYDRPAAVRADPERIEQALYNFLLNAMAHTGPDRLILVRQTIREGKACVEVIDTGEGVAPEDLADIWDRYYKVDKTHKRGGEGFGLGLSIVKAILEQHPGVEYGVLSEPGRGSDFWFAIPLAEGQG